MQSIAKRIFNDYDSFKFEEGDFFVWSPLVQTIQYDASQMSNVRGIWSLLHEIGHARLNHQQYRDDFELLILEVEAWAEAKQLALDYGLRIDTNHIENCIESYRNWLHKRSACIDCGMKSLQVDITHYRCHNCGCRWQVPVSKLCQIRKTRLN